MKVSPGIVQDVGARPKSRVAPQRAQPWQFETDSWMH